MNINIKNLTVGHHMSMIRDAMLEGGVIDNLRLNNADFSSGSVSSVHTRRVRGVVYTVEISYNRSKDIFYANCS